MPRTVTIINILLGIVIIALLAGIATERLSVRLGKTFLPKGGTTAAAPHRFLRVRRTFLSTPRS